MFFRLTPLVLCMLCAGLLAACGSGESAAGSDAKADAAGKPPVASALSVQLVAQKAVLWPEIVQASGSLTAWQEEVIGAEVGSYRIVELPVDIGDTVKKGQLMARLSSDSLEASLRKQRATLAEAVADVKQADSDASRARAVGDSGSLSAQKIEEYQITAESKRAALASAQADLDATALQVSQTRVVAVDAGVVSSRSAVLGNVVSAGTELFRVVRDGRVEWHPELDARQMARVHPGQPAQLVLPSGKSAQGVVRLVAPTLSTSTGRGTVYVSIRPAGDAVAGTYANGAIEIGTKGALALPESAIVMSDGRPYVYEVDDGGRARRIAVETGRRRDAMVEIVGGLTPSAAVVASGGSFLSEGARVTVLAASRTH